MLRAIVPIAIDLYTHLPQKTNRNLTPSDGGEGDLLDESPKQELMPVALWILASGYQNIMFPWHVVYTFSLMRFVPIMPVHARTKAI